MLSSPVNSEFFAHFFCIYAIITTVSCTPFYLSWRYRMLWKNEHEINRCVLCAGAPCSAACPKALDPAGRIRSLYFANPYGAVKDLPENPCADCPAPCEKACILTEREGHIKIRNLMKEVEKIAENAETVNPDLPSPDLSADICGVRLENPFLLSSSVVASSFEMCKRAFEAGWAGAAFKTICLFPQHEASPRFSVVRSRTGSFFGFKNIEQLSDHALEENLSIFRDLKALFPDKVIVASIMGRNEEEWTYLASECTKAGADVLELNFSCPNMEDGALGVTIGQSEELIERFTAAAKKGTTLPVLAKMTPNITDMVPMAEAAKRGSADGIAAINTIKSITGINIDTLSPEPSVRGISAEGGYSGQAVKPIALRFISDLASAKSLEGMHISGMGGIENWRDALEFLLLGSGSLQITTSVMQYGYRIIEDLLSGLAGYIKERNIPDLYSLIGGASENVTALDSLERDTILFPKFHTEKCIGCGRCYISCLDGGHQAISFDSGTRKPKLLGNRCVGCHLCRYVCPAGAIGTASKRVAYSR